MAAGASRKKTIWLYKNVMNKNLETQEDISNMLNTGSPVRTIPPKNIVYSTSNTLKEHVPCTFGCVSSSLVQKFTCKSDKLKISLFFFFFFFFYI